MSYLNLKTPPLREQRLGSCSAYGGCTQDAQKQFGCKCMINNNREFSQAAVCPLVPALGDAATMPDTIIIVHGAVGCGGALHSMGKAIRGRELYDGSQNPRGYRFLSTNLSELDVISGGENKLRETILAAEELYKPAAIIVYSSCTPSIIGDDVDAVCEEMREKITAPILLIHSEGYKTRIFANAYDSNFHAIMNNLFEDVNDDSELKNNSEESEEDKARAAKTVNLMNLYTFSAGDIEELKRLTQKLGLYINIMPIFTHPNDFKKSVKAAVTLSACPTHDDYFLKNLSEKYGVPYIHGERPIGIANTNSWLRRLAGFFGLQDLAEKIIAEENEKLEKALEPFKAILKGKKVMLSAGEMRTLATSVWLKELGMEVVAVRTFHFDPFAETQISKLNPDTTFSVGAHQPHETANIVKNLKPDIFVGHVGECAAVSKLGVPCLPVSLNNNNYCAYKGAYDIARRLVRTLKNNAFNKKLSENTTLPYKESWYAENPFKYIKGGDL